MMFNEEKRMSMKKADELRSTVEDYKRSRGVSDKALASEIGVSPSEFQRFMDGRDNTESTVYEPCETLMDKRFRGHGGKRTRQQKKLPKPKPESVRKSPTPEEEHLLVSDHEDKEDQSEAFESPEHGIMVEEILRGSEDEGQFGQYRGFLSGVLGFLGEDKDKNI